MTTEIHLYPLPGLLTPLPCIEVWRDGKPTGTSVSFCENQNILKMWERAEDMAREYTTVTGEVPAIVYSRVLSVDPKGMTALIETERFVHPA